MSTSQATLSSRFHSDMDLVRRVQRGDQSAFAALFNAHKPRIYSVCLRMTNNTAEAEDLTQDAFLQVFRKLSTFRGDSALSTWLYRVAVNTVLMHFRKKSPRQISLDEPNPQDSRLMRRECGIMDGRLNGSVDRIALARAIKELPAGYRTIFLLHEVEGYEHQEIARLLRCSIGNSKSQLHKAKLRIRELLGYAVAAQLLSESENGWDSAVKRATRKRRTRVRAWKPALRPKAIPQGVLLAAVATAPSTPLVASRV